MTGPRRAGGGRRAPPPRRAPQPKPRAGPRGPEGAPAGAGGPALGEPAEVAKTLIAEARAGHDVVRVVAG
uniref:hypothetical protein n=1 Tax=Nocardia cyriacigeorgica TaxID=135487 RepID=UPI003CC7E185